MRIALVLLLSGFCLALSSAPAARAAQTWTVGVGGGVPGAWVVANTFQPRAVEIAVGDTVSWVFEQPWGVHTVTFLSGQPRPEVHVREGDRVFVNPVAFFPSGGSTYDGTGYRNSGITGRDPALRPPYSLTFTKTGTYEYVCLLHNGMAGTIIVKERVTGTPAEVAARGKNELAATLEAGRKAFSNVKPERQGDTVRVSLLGDVKVGWSFFRFTPRPVVIERGAIVTWENRDPLEFHTVTFTGGEPVPPFTIPEPQPQGPPKLARNMRVWNRTPAGAYDGTGYANSGFLPGFEPAKAPASFSLTFPKSGRYEYWCVIHAPEGMRGVIVVR